MRARDIMTSPAITATPQTTLLHIVNLMLEHRISGVPIVGNSGELVGLVSEGGLVRRKDIGTEQKHSWWLSIFGNATVLADEFVKSHGVTAAEVMTKKVFSATEDTPLWRIAEMLEKEKIKRVPIVRDRHVVGIVSRANLLQTLTLQKTAGHETPSREDSAIREELLTLLKSEPWANLSHVNVMVTDSDSQRDALSLAAKEVSGVKDVVNHAHVPLTLL